MDHDTEPAPNVSYRLAYHVKRYLTTREKCTHNRYMRKLSAHFSFAFIIFFAVLLTPPAALGSYEEHKERILGVATKASLSIPPTAEGPGLLLPDSPLYFLDQLKQTVRLSLAFSPESRAKTHADIAGERLAELRFMLAKNNTQGADSALSGLSLHMKAAGKEVTLAKMNGNDVSQLAKTINTSIKDRQKVLDSLEVQATGEMQARVRASQESLMVAKVYVEEGLPVHELEQEILDDMRRLAQRGAEDISVSATQLEKDIEILKVQEGLASVNNLKAREEAIQKAIEEKNTELKLENERALAAELKEIEERVKSNEKTVSQIKETVRQAQVAAASIKNTEE